ncbi:MAG: hypothetical protein ACHP65_10325 [Legionellales bacterium]
MMRSLVRFGFSKAPQANRKGTFQSLHLSKTYASNASTPQKTVPKPINKALGLGLLGLFGAAVYLATREAHSEDPTEAPDSPPVPFTETQQIEEAARLWAQYLYKNVSFSQINSQANVPDDSVRVMCDMMRKDMEISEQQVALFIDFLCQKIPSLPKQRGNYGLDYIQLGNTFSYNPPRLINQALKHAGINSSSLDLFPFKSVMRIYNTGTIYFNGKIICANKNQVHYDSDFLFKSSQQMVIVGPKFKIFELPCVPGEKIYSGFVEDGRYGGLSKEVVQKDPSGLNTKYMKIYFTDYKGAETELLSMSNEALRNILHDSKKIRQNFKPGAYIGLWETKPTGGNSYGGFGEVESQPLGENLYQYTTGVVRVVLATQGGTLGSDGILYPVLAGDFLIYRGKSKDPDVWSSNFKTHFEGYLCDAKGNKLSDLPCKPGVELLGDDTSPAARP